MAAIDAPVAVDREFVLKLMKDKDSIEDEIKEMHDVLKGEKDVGLHECLVDGEGYPRNDVDVYSVRMARNKIIRLQNDHKQIMIDIEKALHELHSKERAAVVKDDVECVSGRALERTELSKQPFAKIEIVTDGSPAKDAGLQVGDQILEFGSVNCKNFNSLQNIADVVQHSLGKPTSITVLRDDIVVHLGLIQRHWNGKGAIGKKATGSGPKPAIAATRHGRKTRTNRRASIRNPRLA